MYDGALDDFKIYSRALTAVEINASFDANTYKYEQNFTGLSFADHAFTAYAQDLAGNINTTDLWTITVQADTSAPLMNFIDSTP